MPAATRQASARSAPRSIAEEREPGELRSVVASEAGRTALAEGYTGWPLLR